MSKKSNKKRIDKVRNTMLKCLQQGVLIPSLPEHNKLLTEQITLFTAHRLRLATQ